MQFNAHGNWVPSFASTAEKGWEEIATSLLRMAMGKIRDVFQR